MKINKSFLSRIIKEEIKKVLYETHKPWEHDFVQLMVQMYEDSNRGTLKPKQYYIEKFNLITDNEPLDKTLQYFKDEDAVDHDIFKFVAGYLLNDKTSNLFSFYADYQLPASYKDSNPKYKDMDDQRNPYETKAASTFLRKPQPIPPEEQEDPRRNPVTGKEKKNWVHEE